MGASEGGQQRTSHGQASVPRASITSHQRPPAGKPMHACIFVHAHLSVHRSTFNSANLLKPHHTLTHLLQVLPVLQTSNGQQMAKLAGAKIICLPCFAGAGHTLQDYTSGNAATSHWPPQRHPRRIDPSLPPLHEVPRRQTDAPGDEPIPEEMFEDSTVEYSTQGLQELCKSGMRQFDKAGQEDQFDRTARELAEAFRLDYADCADDEFKVPTALKFRPRARQIMQVFCAFWLQNRCLRSAVCMAWRLCRM